MLSQLNFRSNSIGFLRLFFAALVVWWHVTFGGNDHGPIHFGFLAVAGFFVLSGFLITRSFERVGNAGRFMWHRFLRIFPAFWVCLLAAAFGFAPLAFFHEHGTLSGFMSQVPSPWTYVSQNALLLINQGTIGTLLKGLPRTDLFNAPLWSLIWEFLSYLTVLVIGVVGLFKRWRCLNLVALLVCYGYTSFAMATFPSSHLYFGYTIAELGELFWFGGCAYLFRDLVPMRRGLVILCVVAILVASPTKVAPLFIVPCMTYATLYAAMRSPIRNVGSRVDISYGVYIYGFPVQVLLAIYGLDRFGYTAYLLFTFALTLPLAAASWFLIERPCMALKDLALGDLQSPKVTT